MEGAELGQVSQSHAFPRDDPGLGLASPLAPGLPAIQSPTKAAPVDAPILPLTKEPGSLLCGQGYWDAAATLINPNLPSQR